MAVPHNLWNIENQVWEMQNEVARLEASTSAEFERYMARQADTLRRSLDRHIEPFEFQAPFIAGRSPDTRNLYNAGLNALQRRQYDQATQLFDRVIADKASHVDAAIYWKGFAEARLGRTEEALATLAALRRDHPQSRYTNDAKVLEADARRTAGQRIDPQTLDANDEIKLIAINGIANTEPDRAIPLLEGVLGAANTLAIKRRALFVIALNQDPRARQILLRYAKGAGSPELQVKAIRHLISRGDGQTASADLQEFLVDLYAREEGIDARRAVVSALRAQGNADTLVALARKESNLQLKRDLVSALSELAPKNQTAADYLAEMIK